MRRGCRIPPNRGSAEAMRPAPRRPRRRASRACGARLPATEAAPPRTALSARQRAYHSSAEACRADTEGEIEPRSQILERDDVGHLNELWHVEMLAQRV